MELTVWTVTETTSAIIAASIPVLRVFLRDKVSSRRYGSSKNQSYAAFDSHTRSRTGAIRLSSIRKSTAVLGSHPGKCNSATWVEALGDDDSGKSILRSERSNVGLGILQTNTVIVDFDKRSFVGGRANVESSMA